MVCVNRQTSLRPQTSSSLARSLNLHPLMTSQKQQYDKNFCPDCIIRSTTYQRASRWCRLWRRCLMLKIADPLHLMLGAFIRIVPPHLILLDLINLDCFLVVVLSGVKIQLINLNHRRTYKKVPKMDPNWVLISNMLRNHQKISLILQDLIQFQAPKAQKRLQQIHIKCHL